MNLGIESFPDILVHQGGAKLAKTADDNEDEYIEIYEDDR